ncbi:unnamed protein product [Amoebophrya sp. A25]|nr:unnamed protein product [Amoebophrya sp. A25]|eukprot:GSA25T00010020001.1
MHNIEEPSLDADFHHGVSFVPSRILLESLGEDKTVQQQADLKQHLQEVKKNVQVIKTHQMAELIRSGRTFPDWKNLALTANLPNLVYYINFVTTTPEQSAHPLISYNGQVDLLNEAMLVQMCRNGYDFNDEVKRGVVSREDLASKFFGPSQTPQNNAGTDKEVLAAELFQNQIRGHAAEPRKVVLQQFDWRKNMSTTEIIMTTASQGQEEAVTNAQVYLKSLEKIGDEKKRARGGESQKVTISRHRVLNIECATPSSAENNKNEVFRKIDIFFRFIKGATKLELQEGLKGFQYMEYLPSPASLSQGSAEMNEKK